MLSLKSRGVIAAAAGAVMFSGLGAIAAPALPLKLDRSGSETPKLVHHIRDLERGSVFDLRDLFPNLHRGTTFRNRNISERRAGQIANAHTPLRIRDIDRRGRTFVVRGFNRRLGRIAISVDARTQRVLGVRQLERSRPARIRLIGATRAGELARERIRMRITEISLDGRTYNVRGFNRRQGQILVQVNGQNGNIIQTSSSNNGTIGRSGISIDNGTNFRTNRSNSDLRDVGR
jgi:hypothetical protein